jgi:twitching motility protein PilT
MQQRGPAAAFREIPSRVSSLDELGLPALLKDLAMLPKGLVLVTGPTGSGKSTTLAAMIGHANASRRDHILTIEDPVEFVHEPAGCLINQREIGRDSVSFQKALRGALREDPDIILVGEMRGPGGPSNWPWRRRDTDTWSVHLHTMSAPKTVDRIIDAFPGERQAQIRAALSESLRASSPRPFCAAPTGPEGWPPWISSWPPRRCATSSGKARSTRFPG